MLLLGCVCARGGCRHPEAPLLNHYTTNHEPHTRPPVLAAMASRVPSPYVEEAELHFDALIARLHVRVLG